MIGLKRGTVVLLPHQTMWEKEAEKAILLLKSLLKDIVVDIQHVGSTAIQNISAKPIIDIVVGVRNLENVKPYIERLEQEEIIFRNQDVAGQLLFVIGDFAKDTRTYHIHIVEWNSTAWNDYINFRDYLNTFPEQAKKYDSLKKQLAVKFSNNRADYTDGKQELIDRLLQKARYWRMEQRPE